MITTLEQVFNAVSRDNPDLSFVLRLYEGIERRYGEGEPAFVLTVNDERSLHDVLFRGSLGFGEAYMRGGLEVEGDLQRLLAFAYHSAVKQLHLGTKDRARLLRAYAKNNLRRSRQNVVHHYDLGNDFYRLWLDESMTYSCAYWSEDCRTLEDAQRAKYEHICRKLHLREGDRLVDVGCGWGGMLAHAAQRYGVRGVGYTLSDEQHAFANQRFRDLGLYPRVRAELRDYRAAEGEFDKFVSIGMFEHVGRQFYRTFFRKAHELVVPGGIGVMHTIGRDRVQPTDLWVTKYIFPGGYLPSLAEIAEATGEEGLPITDVENLRLHYALTLDAWSERFEARLDQIRGMFDESFVRMWRLYLNGSAAAFRWGGNRVFQVTFTNGLRNDLPLTRSCIYDREGAAV